MWIKVSDIQTVYGIHEPCPDELFFKGTMVEAASFCAKRGYVKFSLEKVLSVDESNQDYIEWKERWDKELKAK